MVCHVFGEAVPSSRKDRYVCGEAADPVKPEGPICMLCSYSM